MPVASAEQPRLAHSETLALERLLRARGHRVSAARRMVLMVLFAADWPVTAYEIASGLGGRLPSAELTVIYRNLEMLEQHNLVYHVHLGHGPRRYRLVSAEERCYVVCEVCDRVDAVAPADLDDARAAVVGRIGYRASFNHFPIVGVCPDCAAAGAADDCAAAGAADRSRAAVD